MNRVSNLITLDLVKKLRQIKNVSMKNYSYEAQKILVDDTNKDINKVNGDINKNQLMKDFIFIHKYGLEVWLKS
jgi:hypothetical protein